MEIDEDRNTLTLRGEKKSEVKHDEGDVHTSERVYGSFVRSWSFPDNVDTKSVKVKRVQYISVTQIGFLQGWCVEIRASKSRKIKRKENS